MILPAGVSTRLSNLSRMEASGSATFTATSEAVEPHAPVCVPKLLVGTCVASRIINVGIVDCSCRGIVTGKKASAPTALYTQFFMTEPALLQWKHLCRIRKEPIYRVASNSVADVALIQWSL